MEEDKKENSSVIMGRGVAAAMRNPASGRVAANDGISPMAFLANAMAHYRNARAKHPYFADSLAGRVDYYSKLRLDHLRESVSLEKQIGQVRALTLLQCEIAEAMDAHANGDTAPAIEECYDTIAVLMRMIDVLEGRQALGKPKEGA